ncbi:cell wall metabolism sensor histidine kinase WalK [Nonomuraea sp. NEAU-A123]|uniref:sensor histidine kinase n=1 Tax=Nonomuraea sp. NEAU-A123 TaxID=2839649 RepID=UPI001BE4CD0E|nr:HAMP domain-containing sensor histidine kinase [Nonomuraea sp. NEAU-A123]MBT2235381.1 HAMP domain-containing histidine kinase [Nonomuraea sp. NEAU-A123]
MECPTHLHDCLYELDRVVALLKSTRSELEQARDQQRQFAADASHELRTPVTGLRTQLEEAQLHPGETALPELLDHALADINRLQQIINDLLLLVHLESGVTTEEEPLDLAELVRTQVDQRQDAIEVKLRLDRGVTVNAVHSLIARLSTNLLDNAQRHATHTVEAEVCHHDGSAQMAITDDGQGVAAPDRERIFEMFSRLDTARDRDRGGIGLGLAIARDIAVAHGGTLVVDQAPCGGARFVLRLPLADPGPA